MDFNELKDAVSSGSDNDSEEYEDWPQIIMRPETAIGFDAITNIVYMPTGWDQAASSYIEKPITDESGNPVEATENDLLIEFENPQLLPGMGTLYEATGRDAGTVVRKDDDVEEWDDYLLLNEDQLDPDNDFRYDQNGNMRGVDIPGTSKSFTGQEVDDFNSDDQRAIVYLSGKARFFAANALDVNGGLDNPQSLMEKKSDFDVDRDDISKRFTRYPQLRDIDWEGNNGGFMIFASADTWNWGGGNATKFFFNDFEGDNWGDATAVVPVEDPAAVRDNNQANFYWAEQTSADDFL
jgi:hypothetical protein